MNSNKHFIVGGVSTFVVSCIIQKQNYGSVNLGKALCHGLMGGGIALLPDMLEPATNPNHRSFFHSFGAGLGIIFFNNKMNNNQNIPAEVKEILNIISLGYGSHLLLDSSTPKSLPLI